MKYLVLLLIVLAWAGWVIAWGRDRQMTSSTLGRLAPVARRNKWAPPRSELTARRRRREVLVGLGTAAVLTLLLAQAWSALWSVHILIDLAALGYGYAVLSIERPESFALVRSALRPVVIDEPDTQAVSSPAVRRVAPQPAAAVNSTR